MANQMNQPQSGSGPAALACRIAPLYRLLACVPDGLMQLLARLTIAPIFWLSGETKVVAKACLFHGDCTPGSLTVMLFQTEYKMPWLDPHVWASLASLSEHLFPVLLILGLATRFAALSLLIMTLMIQFFVYPQWLVWWNTHILWAFPLFYVMSRGPGPVSLDHLIVHFFGCKKAV